MAHFPNQKTITVLSSSGKGGKVKDGETYGIITRKELITAIRVLDDGRNATPIMLFLELALNQNGYQMDFSPARLKRLYGISEERWTKARRILEDKGYLKAADENRQHLIFNSLPDQYRNTITETSSEAKQQIDAEMGTTPADEGSYPRAETGSLAPADEGSNNKTIINNDNKAITTPSEQGSKDCIDPMDEIDNIKAVCHDQFGHLDEYYETLTRLKDKLRSSKYSENEQLRLYREWEKNLKEKSKWRMDITRGKYRQNIERTLPKDYMERLKVTAITKRFLREHNADPLFKNNLVKNGFWINGWNEELQEPNIVVALNALPDDTIKKMRHNISGIPKEYYCIGQKRRLENEDK